MKNGADSLRPRLVAVADLTLENLQAVIRDMKVEPGWYPAADLHNWYAGLARESGLEPVSKKVFGMRMKELGFRVGIKRVCGQPARCWFIPRHAVRSAQEDRTDG